MREARGAGGVEKGRMDERCSSDSAIGGNDDDEAPFDAREGDSSACAVVVGGRGVDCCWCCC